MSNDAIEIAAEVPGQIGVFKKGKRIGTVFFGNGTIEAETTKGMSWDGYRSVKDAIEHLTSESA